VSALDRNLLLAVWHLGTVVPEPSLLLLLPESFHRPPGCHLCRGLCRAHFEWGSVLTLVKRQVATPLRLQKVNLPLFLHLFLGLPVGPCLLDHVSAWCQGPGQCLALLVVVWRDGGHCCLSPSASHSGAGSLLLSRAGKEGCKDAESRGSPCLDPLVLLMTVRINDCLSYRTQAKYL
jgi:hypothetical protein